MPFAQDKDFVGREDILRSIEQGFAQPTTLRRIALAGLGGVGYVVSPGKTSIADIADV